MSNSIRYFLPIQNIILNYRKDAEVLFVHRYNTFPKKYSTDTYFNIFHYTRWNNLTGYNKFFLHVICRGKGTIFLYGQNAYDKDMFSKIFIESYHIDNIDEVKQFDININGSYDFFFFEWEDGIDYQLYIEKAYYSLSYVNFKRDVNIAIISTTYHRIDDINNLVHTYTSACQHDSYFNAVSHLFIINNEYTDKDFFLQCQHRNITIINNKENFGGSGGFSQGARLAVERGGFSHVLFMDDDALIHEESWFRTVALLRCLCAELYDHPVSGTMFTREQPSYCHAAIEALNKHLHRHCLNGAVFLDTSEACREFLTAAHETCCQLRCTEGQVPYPYAAWWYCLFPIGTFMRHGYPAPYFFRGDDMEFALRIKKTPLFLNGICVWHPSFEGKSSPLREYLNLRNYALRCTAHMKGWRYQLIKTFCRKMARCLAANDYERAALTILAVRDFMDFAHVPREGSQLIARVEMQRQRWSNKKERMPCIPLQIDKKSLKHNLLPMLGVFLTFGGALVPTFLRRRCTVAPFLQVGGRWVSQWTAYSGREISRKFQNIFAAQLTIKAIMQIYLIIRKRG